jgi:DNA invertase Pin-like site-specific DNA recombinase
MTRAIIPGKRLFKPFVYQQQALPIERPVALYIRQSSQVQVKKNVRSTQLQDEEMHTRLTGIGFTSILKIEIDQGISGQKRRDQREGLDQLYRLAESGAIGAVAAYDASRWYRDPTHVEYNQFITLLVTHNLPAILFDEENGVRVYLWAMSLSREQVRKKFW